MKWAVAVSEAEDLTQAAAECVRAIQEQLGGTEPDLAVVFPSRHHQEEYASVPARTGGELGAGVLLGCSGGGVIGAGRELEHRAGLSLTAAILPGVRLRPFHLEDEDLPGDDAGGADWERLIGVGVDEEPHFLLLPDPLTFDAEPLLAGLDRAFPTSTKVGGLASGAPAAGTSALFLGGERHESGLVGVAMAGNITVDTIVAQGCRPIGEPMFVTACQDNILMALDRRSPREVLQELHASLEERDRDLFDQSLFLGIVMRDRESEYGQGDFLIRNLVGFDPDSGALAVSASLREGLVVQFHLRDARTSAEDLDSLLAGYCSGEARGSLLFSCLGRGMHLYGRPGHDTDSFRRHLGQVPLGGFFCNGEIGPVQGTTFVHGYTSAFGLFRPRS